MRTERISTGFGHLIVEISDHTCVYPRHVARERLWGESIPDGTRWECRCGKMWRLTGSDANGYYYWEPVTP